MDSQEKTLISAVEKTPEEMKWRERERERERERSKLHWAGLSNATVCKWSCQEHKIHMIKAF